MNIKLYDLKTTLNTVLDKLIGLGTYEKTYGGTYVGTTLGLIVGDPGKKISSLLGVGGFKEQGIKALKTIGELQKSYRLEVLKNFKDITQAQRDRLYSLMLKYDIKNPLNLIHINYGEWEYVTINGVLERRLKGGLHNMNIVEELLKKGDVIIKVPNLGEFTKSNYKNFLDLDEDIKLSIYIKGSLDNRSWKNIKAAKKSLFPKNWTDEDIAETIKKAEELIKTGNNGNLVKILDETTFIEYCKEGGIDTTLPEFKNGLLKEFKETGNVEFSKFGKEFTRNIYMIDGVEIKIGSKYINGKLIEEVTTIFPK